MGVLNCYFRTSLNACCCWRRFIIGRVSPYHLDTMMLKNQCILIRTTTPTQLSVVVCANCLSSLLCYPFHVWPSWHFTVLKFCPFLLDMFLRKHNCAAMFHIRQSYYIDWKRCWSKWCRVVEEVKRLMCFIRVIKVNLRNNHIVCFSDIHSF